MKDDTQVQAQQAGFVVEEGVGETAVVGLSLRLEIPLVATFQKRKGKFHGHKIRHKDGDARIEAQAHGIEV